MHDTLAIGGTTRRAWALRAGCLYAALIPFQPVLTLPDGSPLRVAAAELVAPFLIVAALVRPQRRLAPGLGLLVLALAMVALLSTLLAATERPLTGYAIGKTAGLALRDGRRLALARALPRREPSRALLRALAAGAFSARSSASWASRRGRRVSDVARRMGAALLHDAGRSRTSTAACSPSRC